jgi:hypothetical protein
MKRDPREVQRRKASIDPKGHRALRDRALEGIRDWLTVRTDSEYDVLFTSLDHNTLGKPLSLITNPKANQETQSCQQWVQS